jgi:RNA polymerase primary sigma factor
MSGDGQEEPPGVSGALQVFLADVEQHPTLTSAQTAVLARRLEGGDMDAKRSLIESNLRLVVAIAERYRDQGMSFLELIQAGTLGLNIAVERFDWRRGPMLSASATWWIRAEIQQELAARARTS